jgi:phage terminase small subunit
MSRYASTEKEMTAKEQLFVAAYVAGDPRAFGNATKAALTAGYSEKTASRIASGLIAKPHIKAAINAELKRLSERLNITAEKVLEDISRLSRLAEDAGRFGDAIRGQELLGKHLKLFADKVELTGKDGGPIDMKRSAADLSDDELAAIAARKK